MFKEIIDIILYSMEGSFLQVTVFVGAVLMMFNYINFKTKGAFIETIKNAKKFQPIIGALLGLTPGCGGAIFVMPLFIKGNVPLVLWLQHWLQQWAMRPLLLYRQCPCTTFGFQLYLLLLQSSQATLWITLRLVINCWPT